MGPRAQQTEALKVELEYFISCLLNDQRPFSDYKEGDFPVTEKVASKVLSLGSVSPAWI